MTIVVNGGQTGSVGVASLHADVERRGAVVADEILACRLEIALNAVGFVEAVYNRQTIAGWAGDGCKVAGLACWGL